MTTPYVPRLPGESFSDYRKRRERWYPESGAARKRRTADAPPRERKPRVRREPREKKPRERSTEQRTYRRKATCRRGHPLADPNIVYKQMKRTLQDGTVRNYVGHECKTCHAARQRVRYHRARSTGSARSR